MTVLRRLRKCIPNVSDAVDRLFCTAIFVVIVAVVYRYCWLDFRDPFKCGALLTQGRWLDPGVGNLNQKSISKHLQLWDPPGCLLHTYQAKDLSACLGGQKIVLAGDSTVRQIYWAIAKKLDPEGAQNEILDAAKNSSFKHSDLNFTGHDVDLQFVWDPYLNTSRLRKELEIYRDKPQGDRVALMLVGAGHWFARFIESNPLKKFKDAIDNVASFMNSTERHSKDRPLPGNKSSDLLLLAPVQAPFYDKLSPARAATITPDKIDFMNGYLQQLSAFQYVDIIWSWALMTHQNAQAYEEGGLHVVDNVATRRADSLLNMRCNAAFPGAPKQGFPFDRTCCTNYGRPGWLQWLGLLIGLGALPFSTWAVSRGRLKSKILPSARVLGSLLVLAMVTSLCFYVDRTQIFNKTAKHFTLRSFKMMCGAVLALGVLSIRRSSSGKDKTFLSREQSDEWKGWMQFLILVYHYTGASKILWIYEIIRLLVASYLFMTGFGHTVFFLQKGDYSLRRFASIMIRLNLLSCVLPYMMRTDYMFYYFAPLVSFWFCVIYLTLWIGRNRNDQPVFLLSKFVISAVFVQVLHRTPGILELIFTILKYTCRIHWDVVEWRFRLLLDGTIVYVGMVAAVIYVDLLPDQSVSRFHLPRRIPRLVTPIACIASIVVPLIYWTLTRRSPSKYDYNWWQPWISPFPILSFLILRNSHRHLRNFHSSIYAWLGRISLETFTLQFHIWLAADTKGLLSLGLFNRRRFHFDGRTHDFFVITPIFLYLSWRVAQATNAITSYLVEGGEVKPKRLPKPASASSSSSSSHTRNDSNQRWDATNKRSDDRDDVVVDQLEIDDERSGDSSRQSNKNPGWRSHLVQSWREDLRVRLASLMIGLWILNLVYV